MRRCSYSSALLLLLLLLLLFRTAAPTHTQPEQLIDGDEVMVQTKGGAKQQSLSVFVRGMRFPVKKEYGWDKFKANVSRMAGKGKEPTLLYSEGSGYALSSFDDIEDGMKIEVRTELGGGGDGGGDVKAAGVKTSAGAGQCGG